MDIWKRRVPEIAYLLNPAFCSLVLYTAIFEYQKKIKNSFPYPLIYLVLPVVLHKNTRERINSRTNMTVWLQKYPEVLIGFADRAKSLVPFANENLDFLFHRNIISINEGKLSIETTISKSKLDILTSSDLEIDDCIKKAGHIGRWFALMGAEENIFIAWGVMP